jgi:hypothetical protein
LVGAASLKSKIGLYIWEICKWALVLFLLYPLIFTMENTIDFSRVVIGEALLIIFIGKIFYDTIVWKFTQQNRDAGQDFIAILGMLLAVGFILVVFLFLFAVTFLQFSKSQSGF